jgi:hypothetical protein
MKFKVTFLKYYLFKSQANLLSIYDEKIIDGKLMPDGLMKAKRECAQVNKV